MSTAVHDGNGVDAVVGATLAQAMEKLQAEREAEMEALNKRFEFRMQMLRQAEEGLKMAFGEIDFGEVPETPAPAPQPAAPASSEETEPKLSISEKHLKKIEGYLADNTKARQADLVDKLGLNSGTVSVGLRVLEKSGLVKKAPKERGSRVWEHAAPEDKERRETVLTAGEGVREGRLIQS